MDTTDVIIESLALNVITISSGRRARAELVMACSGLPELEGVDMVSIRVGGKAALRLVAQPDGKTWAQVKNYFIIPPTEYLSSIPLEIGLAGPASSPPSASTRWDATSSTRWDATGGKGIITFAAKDGLPCRPHRGRSLYVLSRHTPADAVWHRAYGPHTLSFVQRGWTDLGVAA